MLDSSNVSNSSETRGSPSPRTAPFIALQYCRTIATFAILGNVLIIFVFSKKRNPRTRTNYFVIGLAFGDILVGTLTIPLYVTLLILLCNKHNKASKLVQDILSGMLSSLQLMTISTSSPRSNVIILAGIWCMAIGIASLNFSIPKGPEWKGTFVMYSTLGFFVSFSVIFEAYIPIWITVKSKTKISRN